MELTEGVVEEIARGHTHMFRPRHRMTYVRDMSGMLLEARCLGTADYAPCEVDWRLKPDRPVAVQGETP